jgi:hypothetical protein
MEDLRTALPEQVVTTPVATANDVLNQLLLPKCEAEAELIDERGFLLYVPIA